MYLQPPLFFVNLKLVNCYFLHNANFVVKDGKLLVKLDDLDLKVQDVAFETKVLNKYGTFDQIPNRSMEDLGYVYLHCVLLNRIILKP
jgi:hypothetical protein